MKWFKPQIVWPLISGLMFALLVLQTNPNLAFIGQQLAQASQPALVNPLANKLSFAPAVKQAAPAVVNIYTAKLVKQRSNPFFDDPFFQQFFGDFFGQQPQEKRQRMQSSLGSGVLVGKGFILTNHHVIKGADEIKVALQDGREALAKLIGSDPDSDLAVLRINLPNLPSISLADSDSLEVGDIVLAIGNPFGVGQTVTQGIVSALGRTSLGLSTYEDFIQTDAAINPGNSGGALINPYGELLGINTAIFSRSGGSQGIGFAIPSNLAAQIMQDLITQGYVTRGWLGIEVQELTPALAQSLGIKKNTQGILVAGLLRSGPAYKGGLRPGDLITHINNQPVPSAKQALNFIASLKPGQKTSFHLLRAGKELQQSLIVGQKPKTN